jgi:FMN reductase
LIRTSLAPDKEEAEMQERTVVVFSGNITRPSKTRRFVAHIVDEIAVRNSLQGVTYDVADLGPSFPMAQSAHDLDDGARRIMNEVIGANALVVASPAYKGSYTGLFKHFFDLVDPLALRGKPVLLAATGGGDRHMLLMEHQLRPLFAFFEAMAMPTSIYATEKDFVEGVPRSPSIVSRVEQGIAQVGVALSSLERTGIAYSR